MTCSWRRNRRHSLAHANSRPGWHGIREMPPSTRAWLNGVKVRSDTIRLTAGTASVPITIVRNTPYPVTVLVRLTSDKLRFPRAGAQAPGALCRTPKVQSTAGRSSFSALCTLRALHQRRVRQHAVRGPRETSRSTSPSRAPRGTWSWPAASSRCAPCPRPQSPSRCRSAPPSSCWCVVGDGAFRVARRQRPSGRPRRDPRQGGHGVTGPGEPPPTEELLIPGHWPSGDGPTEKRRSSRSRSGGRRRRPSRLGRRHRGR